MAARTITVTVPEDIYTQLAAQARTRLHSRGFILPEIDELRSQMQSANDIP